MTTLSSEGFERFLTMLGLTEREYTSFDEFCERVEAMVVYGEFATSQTREIEGLQTKVNRLQEAIDEMLNWLDKHAWPHPEGMRPELTLGIMQRDLLKALRQTEASRDRFAQMLDQTTKNAHQRVTEVQSRFLDQSNELNRMHMALAAFEDKEVSDQGKIDLLLLDLKVQKRLLKQARQRLDAVTLAAVNSDLALQPLDAGWSQAYAAVTAQRDELVQTKRSAQAWETDARTWTEANAGLHEKITELQAVLQGHADICEMDGDMAELDRLDGDGDGDSVEAARSLMEDTAEREQNWVAFEEAVNDFIAEVDTNAS